MNKTSNQFDEEILNIFGASQGLRNLLTGGTGCGKDMMESGMNNLKGGNDLFNLKSIDGRELEDLESDQLKGGECGCGNSRPMYGGNYDHKVKKYLHKIREYLNKMQQEDKEIPEEYKKYLN